MNKDNMTNIATTGTTEDLANLLKSYGNRSWNYYNTDSKTGSYGHCLDTICSAANSDTDEARKAAKKTIIASYAAMGNKAFRQKTSKRPELDTLRQFAFNSASEKIIALLKAQGDDPEAVRAIIEGVQKDRKRRFRRETTDDKHRRRNKQDVLSDFWAKAGPFAPDPLDEQITVATLQNQLAEAERRLADQAVAKQSAPALEKARTLSTQPR